MKKREFNTKSFAIAALRRASYRTPMRGQVMSKARVARGKYVCANCLLVHGRKEIQVDHIHPVVAIEGWDSFDAFINRLFCAPEGLQVLCKPCHKLKSKQENALRPKRVKK